MCCLSSWDRQTSLWLKNFLYHSYGTYQKNNYNSKFATFGYIFNYWFKVFINRVRSVSCKKIQHSALWLSFERFLVSMLKNYRTSMLVLQILNAMHAENRHGSFSFVQKTWPWKVQSTKQVHTLNMTLVWKQHITNSGMNLQYLLFFNPYRQTSRNCK